MAPRVILFAAPALGAASFLLMLGHVEPFYTHFYSFAWWSYIFLLAARNEGRTDVSRFPFPSLFRRPLAYLGMVLLSAAVWFFFELYNVRLRNWVYVGVPAENWIRWPGYFVAFGSVLPGIFETARLFERRLQPAGPRPRVSRSPAPPLPHSSTLPLPIPAPPSRPTGTPERIDARGGARDSLRGACAILGLVCMTAPLFYPQWFFPLIWLGLIFLLDPLSERLGEESLLRDLLSGDRCRPLLLLGSGLVCGLFWEFWNYWSGAKWVYTLPYFQSGKIFEMPLLGYLGFPPFALECWLFYSVARRSWEHGGVPGRIAMALLITAVSVAGVGAVDRYVVKSYRLRPPKAGRILPPGQPWGSGREGGRARESGGAGANHSEPRPSGSGHADTRIVETRGLADTEIAETRGRGDAEITGTRGRGDYGDFWEPEAPARVERSR